MKTIKPIARDGLQTVFGRRIFLCVEFLNGVNGEMASRSALNAFGVDDGGCVVRIVAIDTVNDEVVVFGTIAVGADREKSATGITLDTRAQGDEILEIAAIQRKVIDFFVAEGAAEGVVGSVEERNFFRDEDSVGNSAWAEIEVEVNVFSDLKLDVGALGGFETLGFDTDLIFARGEIADEVFAGGVGGGGTTDATLGVCDGDGGTPDGAAGVVFHGTKDTARGGLSRSYGDNG